MMLCEFENFYTLVCNAVYREVAKLKRQVLIVWLHKDYGKIAYESSPLVLIRLPLEFVTKSSIVFMTDNQGAL